MGNTDWVSIIEQKTGVQTPSYEDAKHRDYAPIMKSVMAGVTAVVAVIGVIFVKEFYDERKKGKD